MARRGVCLKFQRDLRRVLEAADVHVAGRSDGGHASPGGFVSAPHIEQKRCGGAGDGLSMRDHELVVNVPVDVGGRPDDLEVVTVSLVESSDLGILEI